MCPRKATTTLNTRVKLRLSSNDKTVTNICSVALVDDSKLCRITRKTANRVGIITEAWTINRLTSK